MKKFLKAVALATVMCMLLSVSAFAAVDEPAANVETDEITLSVAAGKGEQVAILVVAHDAVLATLTDAQIEYIGQETADASTGIADFGTFKVKNADAKVDIYVGSATLSTTEAKKVGEDIDLKGIEKITIVTGEDAKITGYGEGEGGKRGFAAAITANVPAGLKIVAAKWAFKVENEGWKYSATVTDHNQAALATEGAVQFAAAFNAYAEADGEFTDLVIEDVAVIFLTGESIEAAKGDEANTHYVANDATSAELKEDGPFAANN